MIKADVLIKKSVLETTIFTLLCPLAIFCWSVRLVKSGPRKKPANITGTKIVTSVLKLFSKVSFPLFKNDSISKPFEKSLSN
ncbi:hypothetical protein A5875_003819, partial [Enterococcus sp. 3H8_DIV0648]